MFAFFGGFFVAANTVFFIASPSENWLNGVAAAVLALMLVTRISTR